MPKPRRLRRVGKPFILFPSSVPAMIDELYRRRDPRHVVNRRYPRPFRVKTPIESAAPRASNRNVIAGHPWNHQPSKTRLSPQWRRRPFIKRRTLRKSFVLRSEAVPRLSAGNGFYRRWIVFDDQRQVYGFYGNRQRTGRQIKPYGQRFIIRKTIRNRLLTANN